MSTLLDRPGAVDGSGIDAGVAAHYGNPHREQRLLQEGLAVVDLSHRGVVTITGPDRLNWLHSLTTQHLTDLPPRTGVETLILSPKGHVEHALHVVDDGTTTWLTTEPGAAEVVSGWLDSMRFMLRVEVADVSSEYAVLGEPIAAESVEGEPLAWVDPWPRTVGDTHAYGPQGEAHPGHGRAWRELIVPRSDLEAAVGDRPLAGTWAAEALRVAAWRPRGDVDTDHRSIPHELDWLRTAVHLQKGCYRGQETVARVKNLGRPPRRVVFLHLDGSGHVSPEPGTELVPSDGGRAVGTLRSVARHYEDGPIALALVKFTTDPSAVLLAGDVSASQTTIVPVSAERPAQRPRIPRA
ncbi:YgfZ/GcvT domain-containing protein [Ornithinimicrobium pratense]|uniref:Folate-binding protein YgfZ n=1 Tax=Ornithinimicrobium pratense TaxID=2593973 RepID=A0A5J6V6A9_9MICO|nr:folate-binding protein YgfZ [Ornithinimicrobium pratense]QFG69550.1 folate-binding protein YgfZ [Ornithinimicrobium pratense]